MIKDIIDSGQIYDSEPDWKAIAEDRAQAISDLCNRAWGAVYGKEHETEWEYPAQAIRHLIQAYREVKATLAASRAVNR